jgi:hypothetical protein
METGKVIFERAEFFRFSKNEKDLIFDYEISSLNTTFQNSYFYDKIRVEKDNGFHDRSRNFNYWLYFRNDTNWKRCRKTGLAKTSLNDFFEGNISRELHLQVKNFKGKNYETEQHLIIVNQSNDFEKLTIDIFENFYIHDKKLLKIFIDEHFQKHYSSKIIDDHE